MKILLIRHGDPNYEDDCLTDKGKKEAQCLNKMLKEISIDDIYVSPLGRAQETCNIATEGKNILPTTLDWLMERNITANGKDSLWESYGETYLNTSDNHKPQDRYNLDKSLPEGVEQFNRVKNGFDKLLSNYGYIRNGEMYDIKKHSDKTVALFCHKGLILTLLSDILHWPLPMIFVSLHIDTTSVTTLKLIENNKLANFKAISINDTKHLHLCPNLNG